MEEMNKLQQRPPKERARKEKGGPETGGRLLRDQEGVGTLPSSSERVPSPWDDWVARFCVPFIPKTSRRLITAQLLAPLSTNSL